MCCLLDGFEDLLHNFRVHDLPLVRDEILSVA
jgi:hypothetical protein